MSLRALISIMILFMAFGSTAQNTMDGRVLELGSSVPIAGVKITNISSGNTAFSDTLGRFRIGVRKGDLIVLTSYLYLPDTVFLTDIKARNFFLQTLSHQLKDVTITSVNAQLGSLADKETFRRNTGYQRNDDGTIKGGLSFRLRYWNKDSKKERTLATHDKRLPD